MIDIGGVGVVFLDGMFLCPVKGSVDLESLQSAACGSLGAEPSLAYLVHHDKELLLLLDKHFQ